MELLDVADVVWSKCFGAKPNEKALVIADPSGERLEIGEALAKAGSKFCRCDFIRMKPTGLNGREPFPEVARKMLKYDIVAAPLEYSITHTKVMKALREKGGRAATMPGITKDIFFRAISIDYDVLSKTNAKLREAMLGGKNVRLTTKAGTDITMRMAPGRKVCNGDGIIKAGKVKNLPDGEVSIAPEEGSAEGTIVFDLSTLGERLSRPFKVVVKGGVAVSCEHKRLWDIISGVENGTNMAELGIGTNPKAKITGNILEDEKVKGTAHMAFGTNASMGGLVQTSLHLDSVLGKPTIELDGKTIIKEGKILF